MAEYVVKSGDTLGKIAQEFYGDPSKYMLIVNANNLSNPNNISVGQKLIIPQQPGNGIRNAGRIRVNENFSPAPNGGREEGMTNSSGDLISVVQLKQIMTLAKEANINKYISYLNKEMKGASINTPLRIAHFIAQLAHESSSFRVVEENLNYSAEALEIYFGKYFKDKEEREAYARKPEKIANRVYGSRYENGDEASGDGWRYRGRGLIQLTFKSNYRVCGEALGLDLVGNPDQVKDNPEIAVKAAIWFWTKNNINLLADKDDVIAVTKKINGGTNGLDDRKEYLRRAKQTLGIT